MSIEIAGITFDRVSYDADGDVLYLHHGDPSTAVDFDASPEGHALRFDARGDLVGVTIVSARWLLEHEGEVRLTIPTPELLHLSAEQLPAALRLPNRRCRVGEGSWHTAERADLAEARHRDRRCLLRPFGREQLRIVRPQRQVEPLLAAVRAAGSGELRQSRQRRHGRGVGDEATALTDQPRRAGARVRRA